MSVVVPQPAMPTFGSLQTQAPPAAPVNTPSAPSGGANSPPVPVQPGGMGLPSQAPPVQPSSYIAELESQGLIPKGRFTSERELIDQLYSVAGELKEEVDRFKQAPPATPAAAPPATPTAPVEDLTKMATVFQQNGWLAHDQGQWVARNPAASQLAQQLNQQVLEVQARQAELADPESFIRKYGKKVFDSELESVKAELKAMRDELQAAQAYAAQHAPKPWDGFIKQYEGQLWTTDHAGQRVHTQAGKAYHDAFEMGKRYQMSPEDLHNFAVMATQPYLTNQQPTAQPQQSWMQQVAASPPVADPSFTQPGSLMNQQVPPTQRSVPLNNHGFPTFETLSALPR